MTLAEFFVTVFPSVLASSAVASIVAPIVFMWLKARLEAGIKHEYDQKLEELKSQIKMREQAAGVASLLAMAAMDPKKTAANDFNRLAWELSIWLPAPLVRDLTRSICREHGAPDLKDILIAVRKHIRGSDDGLLAAQIIHRDPTL